MTRMILIFGTILLLFSPNLQPAVANTPQANQDKKIAKTKERIRKIGTGERASVKVTLTDKTSYQGYVSRSTENDFEVTDKAGNRTTIRYSEVDSISGKGLSSRAKIWIGVGIGAIATLATLFTVSMVLD